LKISIIIPVYNEVQTVGQTVARACRALLPEGVDREILVVDDGSTDGTRAILWEFRDAPVVRILSLGKNSGKTRALLTGIDAAEGDFLIFQDADLEYDPAHYGRLLTPVIEGRASIVFGSRFLGSIRNMNFLVRMANQLNTWIVNVLYRTSLTDVNTGFKVIPREFFRDVRITSGGFGGDAEITARLLRMRQKIVEVPIDYTARSRIDGKKMNWLNAVHMFGCFFFYRLDHARS